MSNARPSKVRNKGFLRVLIILRHPMFETANIRVQSQEEVGGQEQTLNYTTAWSESAERGFNFRPYRTLCILLNFGLLNRLGEPVTATSVSGCLNESVVG